MRSLAALAHGLRRAGGLVVALAAVMLAGAGCSSSQDPVVATMDGVEVRHSQVAFHMGLALRDVQNQVQQDRGSSAGFDWDEDTGQGPARHILQDVAVERALADQQTLMLAREQDLISSDSFTELMAAREQSNRERVEAAERGEVVYGVVEQSPADYYAATMTDLENQLHRQMSREGGDLFVSEAEIEARYEEDPESWAASVADYHVDVLRVPFPVDETERDRVRLRLGAALGEAETLADVVAEFPDAAIGAETIDGSEAVSLAGPERELLSQLTELGEGGITSAVEWEGWFVSYQLKEVEIDTHEALEAYSPRIRAQLVSEKFDVLMQRRVDEAQVDVDVAALREITMKEVSR